MEKKNKDIRLLYRILNQARPYRNKIVAYFLLSLLATPLALLTPIPLKIVVDNVIGEQRFPHWLGLVVPDTIESSAHSLLLFAIGLFILISLLSSLQSIYSDSVLKTKITQTILLDFRSRLLSHAQKLSIGFHDGMGTDHTSYRVNYDANAIQNVIFSFIIPLISAVVTFCSMFYIIFLLDRTLALIALVISPLIFLLTHQFRMPLRKNWRQYKRLDHASLTIVNEALHMVRVIKALRLEDLQISRFRSRSEKAIDARVRVEMLQGALTLLMALATAVGTVMVLYIGTLHVLEGVLSLGSLLVVMSYLSQLYSPLKTIGSKAAGLQSYLTSAERAFNLLDQPQEVPEVENALPIQHTRGQIKFDRVSFGYTKRKRILHDISFEAKSGMRVGIVGRTGAGKSTLMSLLFRFYDPDAGRILLDGADIRNYKVKDLRQQFAIVLQDSILFSGTIRENIAYGAVGCSDEQITEAATIAGAHEFISRLPKGYETKVGEKGMQLSGGERQRIALARAFISKAAILILDEPTSAVDTKTETLIVKAMEEVMKGKTTFVIAHRLTTLESCDLLIIIDEGRIVRITTEVSRTIREAIDSGGIEIDAKGEFVD